MHLRTGAALAGVALAAVLCGCGYIGEPLPPLLNIPMPANDLAAVERGAFVIVHFTLPALTTEGRTIRQAMRLDLRIGPKLGGPFHANDWLKGAQPVGGAALANGLAEYRIPVAPWIGKDVQIAAKVIGANGRSENWSNVATLTIIQPLPQPTDLRAEAAPHGAHLMWHAPGNAFAVFRRGPDAAATGANSPATAAFAAVGRSDKSEWTDTTAEFGKTYHYVVQAVAKAGEGEAQSDLSNEVSIAPVDTFVPAAPEGLTAVPSTSSIELVWERSADTDLAGYRVYRAEGDGPFARIADTQEVPSFSDHKIESGKAYRYAVTSVKRNGLESDKSPAVAANGP